MTYSEKLKDPRWQKKRLQILERDGFRCRHCGDAESTLNVHHLAYGAEPWDTADADLMTICEGCHEIEHANRKECERTLLQELRRKGFTFSSLLNLATGIHYLDLHLVELSDKPDEVAEILLWAMTTPSVLWELRQQYNESKSRKEPIDDLPYS